MKQHILNILFWLYKSKKNTEGQSPIYCRITVNGVRLEVSTHRYIESSDWNSARQIVKGRSDEALEHNQHLEAFKQKIRNTETELMKMGKEISAMSMKNCLDGKDFSEKGIVAVADYHQEIILSKLDKGYSQSAIKSYQTSVKYIKAFIRHHYKCGELPLSEIEYNFILEFERYVKGHTECNQNGTMAHIKRLKRIIHFAIENEWLDRSPFLRYKAKYEHTNREFITLDELTKIEQKDFSIPRLQLVKDLFLFACYTGKGYKDMMNLKPENISIRLYGKQWLVGERSKTNVQSDVPLLPIPLEIIERYKNHPEVKNKNRLFPPISSQKLNAYLKEIADLSGVAKTLTFYLGRHTFATTICADNGVPIETTSKLLGHTNISTTQIYYKTTPHKVSFDMGELEKVLSNKKYDTEHQL